MTRFWITLNKGVEFVLSSLNMMQGGELFVPKIASMSIVRLAKVMAPDRPQKIVGIRPGEKLHEVMITEEDAPFTIELEDRYVVQPALAWWNYKGYDDLGKPVAENFRYASDNNPEWLDTTALKVMLDNTPSIHG